MQQAVNLTKKDSKSNIRRSNDETLGLDWNIYGPIILVGIGLGLRLFQLDAKSLRLDESYNYGTATGVSSWDLLTGRVYRSGHPPFFYLAWHQWIKYLGNDEFVLRLPMAIFGTIQILAVYIAGRKMFNFKVGIIAAAGITISPFLVSYSQEAGVYSLFAAASACMMALFWQATISPKLTNWLWFSLAALATMYIHLFTLFIFAVEPLLVLPLLLHSRPYRSTNNSSNWKHNLLRGWLVSLDIRGAALLAVMPTLTNAIHQPVTNPLPFISLPQIFYKLFKTYTYRLPTLIDNHTLPELLPTVVAVILLVIGTLPALSFVRNWFASNAVLVDDKEVNSSFASYALIWWLIIPPLIVYGLSFVVHAFAEPYFIFGSNFFWLLVANGLVLIWQRHGAFTKFTTIIFSLILIASAVWWLGYIYFDPRLDREPWREAGEFLTKEATPGDVLLLEPDYDYKSVSYYYLGYLPLPTFLMGAPYDQSKAQELLNKALAYKPPHVWLIFRHDDADVITKGYLRLLLDKTMPIESTWRQNLLEVREYKVP